MPMTMGEPGMGGGTPTAYNPRTANGGAVTEPGGGGTGGAGDPYYAPPDGSNQAAEDYTTAQRAYQNALIRFNQQRQGLLTQYGYKGTIDPTTGMMSNVGVDTSSEVGALQQMLHGQAIEDQNAAYGMQDRGIFGGLANQAQTELHNAHSAQSSGLANTLLDNLSGLDSQQLDAKGTLADALWQYQHQATTDAINAGDYNPADTGADTSGGGGPTGSVPATRNNPRATHVARYVQGSAGRGSQYAPKPKPKPNAYNTNKNKRG